MTSTEQNFSSALETWRDINLAELQKILDAQGVELVDNQKESVLGRKALADKTKEFKKIPDGEKLNAIKGLLKAYQTEIDSLTKRSKASENAFLNVYKVLAEAPDPYPLLEAAVDQTVRIAEAREHELELGRLRAENAELRKRSADVSTLESSKKKVETKLEQVEQRMDEMIQEKVAQKENELHATYDEKLRNYEEREQDLQRQVSLANNQLRDLRMSNDSNQAKLLDHTHRQDQEVITKLAELDMIVADLDRANSRVATVERRNEILRAEIETLRSGMETSDRVKSLQDQVADLEAENTRVSRALETQKASLSDCEATLSKKTEEFSKDIAHKLSEVEHLKKRLREYSDYDEIKRELEIMKYVEFAGLDDDLEETEDVDDESSSRLHLPNPNAQKANAQRGKSLEVLLATKNKRILEELTKFRIMHTELENSLRASQEDAQNFSVELTKQRDLNEKLENDLLSLNEHRQTSDTSSEGSVDVLASLGNKSSEPNTRTTAIPFTSSADTSILPIVTSQRDRFRQRNAELEDELRKQFSTISELRNEVKSLQSDNLKLYEKVRYMQSYREEAGTRPHTTQLNPLPTPANRQDDMPVYQARYEEAMNPFEAFRGREATRAYQSLNRAERGVLVLTRSILGNRRARTFFIFYALALHALVLFSTYECTITSGSQVKPSPFAL